MTIVSVRYVAIIAVGIVAITAIAHSFTFSVINLAFEFNRHIVPLMADSSRRKLGVTAWCGCLVGLIGTCFLVDTLLFPHTAREIVRAWDAAFASLLGMVVGYFVNRRFDPSHRAKPHTQQIVETNL